MRPFIFALAIVVMVAGAVSPAAWAEDGASTPPAQHEAAISTPSATTAVEPAKPQVAKEERMICKAEKTTGSNRIQRVCRSAEQIRRERDAARQSLDKRSICANCGGG